MQEIKENERIKIVKIKFERKKKVNIKKETF